MVAVYDVAEVWRSEIAPVHLPDLRKYLGRYLG
jgi:hypothetical protein